MLKIINRFFSFIWVYKFRFGIFLAVLTIASICENLVPYLYKILVDNISGGQFNRLFTILICFTVLKVLVNWLNALWRYLGDRAFFPAARDARISVFRQVQDLDFAFHANKNTGSLISAFKRGDGAYFNIFDEIATIYSILISLLVVLFFLSRVDPIISFLMIGIFIGNSLFSWLLIKNNIRKRAAFNKAEDDISGIITDNLLNYETVKYFAKEEKEERRLVEEFKGWLAKLWGYSNSFRLMDITIGTFSNIGIFLIFYIVIKKMKTGEIGVGDFVMIASFMTGFYHRFFEMLFRLRGIAKNLVDIRKYFSILDEEIVVKDPPKPVDINDVKGEIRFNKVGFCYPDGKQPVLKDLDLTIKAGESVAFVGKSGAGKTTLVKLLLRFYDVSEGEIQLDRVDIRLFTKSKLRSFMGVVPQEPILFNNTIGFNIAYGSDRVEPQDIIESAKMANLHAFIDQLPDKYETQVGERGIKLSGGQKQRLAIARMMLSYPRIIIFDEATSNLDSESESLIQDALWKIAKGRTVLIIAHRFSTVRKAGKIIVLSEGRMVESGSHDDLITKEKGLYRYLWEIQAKAGQEVIDVS